MAPIRLPRDVALYGVGEINERLVLVIISTVNAINTYTETVCWAATLLFAVV